jgi:hypothetical protein
MISFNWKPSTKLTTIIKWKVINCIYCNKENLESKMKWILDKQNRKIVDEIRLKGMNLVRNNHNTNNRSETFNSLINNKYF